MKKVLVVDDSATVRHQLRTFLESKGFTVSEAQDGIAGVTSAGKTPFDLIIVDMNMPMMTGFEMIAEVRRLAGYAKTPIFVLTTDAALDSAQKGKEVGATAWIVKPYKPDALLAGINKVLGL
jgi:two-component system chemotaxis response regulator CheY